MSVLFGSTDYVLKDEHHQKSAMKAQAHLFFSQDFEGVPCHVAGILRDYLDDLIEFGLRLRLCRLGLSFILFLGMKVWRMMMQGFDVIMDMVEETLLNHVIDRPPWSTQIVYWFQSEKIWDYFVNILDHQAFYKTALGSLDD